PGVVVIESDLWPVPETITEAAPAIVEMVEVPPEIVAPPVKARTRQVARKPRTVRTAVPTPVVTPKAKPKPVVRRK
ncbi:MAG: hypothetical protein V2A79_09465, partial [Planctomycetota bacterium]